MAKDKKKKSKKFLVLLVALLLVLIYAVSLVTDFCGGFSVSLRMILRRA